MRKRITPFIGFLVITLFGCAIASANTLSGYALKGKRLASDSSSRWGGALVEFKDATTNQPVKIDIVTGKKVEGRKDALYALDTGDIGKWEVKVKSGNYLVTIGGNKLNSSYTLPLAAFQVTCTGYYNIKTDFNASGISGGDDTQEIKNAINHVTSCGGGTIFFPQGYYDVGTTTPELEKLPFIVPSGLIIEGTNGAAYSQSSIGNTRITLRPAATLAAPVSLFKIGEVRHQMTFRDITLLALKPNVTPGIETYLANSTAILGQGNYPNSSFGVLLSNMSIVGFQIGVDVKGCIPTAQNPNCDAVWQLDSVKSDHVWYRCATGIQLDTPNTDWEISSSWFAMYALPAAAANVNRGISILHGGFIQINNTFGGATGTTETTRGGDFLYVEHVAALTIIGSQTENVTNSIVWGKDPSIQGAGDTISKIIIVGSEFGEPIRLRQIVNLISTGNHYGPQTIQTSNAETRIYSTGDKFCQNGFYPGPPTPGEPTCGTNPGVQGPATVVFSTGQLAETNTVQPFRNNPELPNRLGIRTEVKDGNTASDKPVFSVTAANGSTFTRPLFKLGQSDDLSYTFSRNKDNGYLEIKGLQAVPWKGIKVNSLIQFEGITWAELQSYGTAVPGAMVYCTTCKAGTNGVCAEDTASNPEGAFARLYNLVWKCN